jgi:single-stranded DNA-binding protein
VNKIECAFVGTLGQPADLRQSKAGKPWCSLNVRIGEGDGLQWLRVAVFGEMAEAVATLDKGASVYVEGSLTLRTWQTDAGEQRSGLNVAASRIEPLAQIGRRRQQAGSRREPVPVADWQRPLDSGGPGSAGHGFDDAVPF